MNPKSKKYHLSQMQKPYRSTELFHDWLEKLGAFRGSKKILDVATGAGGNLLYLARKHPEIGFTGIDKDAELVSLGNKQMKKEEIENAVLRRQNLYTLGHESAPKADGIVSFQLLSWLPHYDKALEAMIRLEPKWIAATSLFYEGDIDAFITLHDYYRRKGKDSYEKMFYNVYSLNRFRDFLKKKGYKNFKHIPFEIDIDIEQKGKDMATHTKKLRSGERLQFSGPLYLPWHFAYASRTR